MKESRKEEEEESHTRKLPRMVLKHNQVSIGLEWAVPSTDTIPSDRPHLTLESFLSRLPKTVVREGRVIDIHSGLTETLRVQYIFTPHC